MKNYIEYYYWKTHEWFYIKVLRVDFYEGRFVPHPRNRGAR